MQSIEFRTDQRGNLFYAVGKQGEKRFTKFCTGIIRVVLDTVKDNFPECFARLSMLYQKREKSERDFMMAQRFIRCNFGKEDHLSPDLEFGQLNFEEVSCPLRGGFCEDEGVICKPKGLYHLSEQERAVASLYVKGFTFKAIACMLHKNESTVKTQLWNIKNKLGVKSCREIITVLRIGGV